MPSPPQSPTISQSDPSSCASASISPGSSFLMNLPMDEVVDVLHLALVRGELKDLEERIRIALIDRASNATLLYRLAFNLAYLGHDFTPAFNALQKTYLNHCERCHQWYDERHHLPNACTVLHAPAIVSHYPGYPGDPNLYWGRFYPCCGLNEVFPVGGPPPAWFTPPCFVGPHAPSSGPLEVSLRIGTCNDLGCYRALENMQRSAVPAPPEHDPTSRPLVLDPSRVPAWVPPRPYGLQRHAHAAHVQPVMGCPGCMIASARSSTPPNTHP
ncbi:hypothetical protein FKP32DRAFT_1753529 [Trametes sanguinea]|nr:hypothetical protein FKP32DRAFT_1753529 [Trametes sanguinea]